MEHAAAPALRGAVPRCTAALLAVAAHIAGRASTGFGRGIPTPNPCGDTRSQMGRHRCCSGIPLRESPVVPQVRFSKRPAFRDAGRGGLDKYLVHKCPACCGRSSPAAPAQPLRRADVGRYPPNPNHSPPWPSNRGLCPTHSDPPAAARPGRS